MNQTHKQAQAAASFPGAFLAQDLEQGAITSGRYMKLSFSRRQKLLVEAGLRPGAQDLADVGKLREARTRLVALTRKMPVWEKTQLEHSWSFSMSQRTWMRLQAYAAVTFMPSHTGRVFRPHPLLAARAQERSVTPARLLETAEPELAYMLDFHGHACAELFACRALTLTWQAWKHSGGEIHPRLDAFAMEVDNRGVLRIGGIEDGQEVRHTFWLNLLREPLDRHSPALRKFATTTQEGLDMLYACEKAVCAGEGVRSGLSWPRLWYGFVKDDDVRVEEATTEAFRRDAVKLARTWADLGKPAGFHPSTDILRAGEFGKRVQAEVSWRELVEGLGPDLNEFVYGLWVESQLYFDGLYWLPGDWFAKGSAQKPWSPSRHARTLLTFDSDVTGREHAGDDGVLFMDPFRARVQVLPLSRSASTRQHLIQKLVGRTEHVRYHLLRFLPQEPTAA